MRECLRGGGQISAKSTEARLLDALGKNLFPLVAGNETRKFDVETLLVCRATAGFLRNILPDAPICKMFEELALEAIAQARATVDVAGMALLINELPEILKLPYPCTKEILRSSINIMSDRMRYEVESRLDVNAWAEFYKQRRVLETMSDILSL